MLSGPGLGSSVQSRSVTPCERHLYEESGLFYVVVRESGRGWGHHGVTGAANSRWRLQTRAGPAPKEPQTTSRSVAKRTRSTNLVTERCLNCVSRQLQTGILEDP